MKIWKYILKKLSSLNLSKKSKGKAALNSNLINSASELTLDKFIVCICEENYGVLVKKPGNYSLEEYQLAWIKIYDEYISAIKDKEQDYAIQVKKDCLLLEFKIEQINLCIKYLEIRKKIPELGIESDKEVLDILKTIMPIYAKFDESDTNSYLKDLQAVLNQSRRFVIELDHNYLEVEKIFKPGKKAIREDFERIISQVSRFMKFQVVKQNVTVLEFATWYSDMRLHQEYYLAKQNAE